MVFKRYNFCICSQRVDNNSAHSLEHILYVTYYFFFFKIISNCMLDIVAVGLVVS